MNFENKLKKIADKMRDTMDRSECRDLVLGLIFLKLISDINDSSEHFVDANRNFKLVEIDQFGGDIR